MVNQDEKSLANGLPLVGGPMAKDLFEITIFGKRRDLTYVVGALVIILSLGFVIWAGLTIPMH
jgi:hypothetical protein